MLPCALSFLAGILLVLQLPELPSRWWGLLIVPLLFAAWYRPRLLPPAFLVAGLFWASVYAGARLNDRLSAELEGRDLVIQGIVHSIPRETAHGSRFDFIVESYDRRSHTNQVPRLVRLSLYRSALRPDIGERWRFTVRLKRPHGFQNPGGFDYEAYLFQQGIRARGYVRSGNRIGQVNDYWLGRFRRQIASTFENALPESEFVGVLTALATGSRNGINKSQWDVFRITGTSHLMAISGLHIGMVAVIGFFLFRWIWSLPGTTVLRVPAPMVGAAGAVLVGTLYAALAGFSIPTQRALVMLVVAMSGLVLLKKIAPTTLIGVALFAVLAFDPMATLSPGFWLSFLAVSVIIMSAHKPGHNNSSFIQLIKIQWLLAIALIPATILFFQSASLAAPVANLIAVPLFTVAVVPLTLLSAIAGEFLPMAIAASLLSLAAAVLTWLWWWLSWLAELLPLVRVSASFSAIVIAVIGVMIFLLVRHTHVRWIGVLGFVPLFYWPFEDRLQPGEVTMTMLDVGQGLAVVVQTRSHTLVYDTGPRFSPEFDTGSAVVAPYLRHVGVSAIDKLMVSHGDNDHIGGSGSLMRELNVHTITTSVPGRFRENASIVNECRAGERWRWDNVSFEMLSPPKAIHGNNGSCVLRIYGQYGAILLPGDIERKQERWLIQQYGQAMAADVLIAPHHGSRTSSSQDFIHAVGPKLTLFPVGYLNRYRHPDKQVVRRYRANNSAVLMSPVTGAVQITISRNGHAVITWRQENRRFWFHLPEKTRTSLRQ